MLLKYHTEKLTSLLVKKCTVPWLGEDGDENSKDLSKNLVGLYFEGMNRLCYKIVSM